MTVRAQILLVAFLLVVLMVIINMVRKRQLELKYVLAWMICDIALIIVTLFPHLMQKMANALGIHSPVNMIFLLGFLFSLIIIFTLTVALSRTTAKMRRIAQILAIMQEETKKEPVPRPDDTPENKTE